MMHHRKRRLVDMQQDVRVLPDCGVSMESLVDSSGLGQREEQGGEKETACAGNLGMASRPAKSLSSVADTQTMSGPILGMHACACELMAQRINMFPTTGPLQAHGAITSPSQEHEAPKPPS